MTSISSVLFPMLNNWLPVPHSASRCPWNRPFKRFGFSSRTPWDHVLHPHFVSHKMRGCNHHFKSKDWKPHGGDGFHPGQGTLCCWQRWVHRQDRTSHMKVLLSDDTTFISCPSVYTYTHSSQNRLSIHECSDWHVWYFHSSGFSPINSARHAYQSIHQNT